MLKLKYLGDIKSIIYKKTHTAEQIIEVCSCRISVEKKYKNTHEGVLK